MNNTANSLPKVTCWWRAHGVEIKHVSFGVCAQSQPNTNQDRGANFGQLAKLHGRSRLCEGIVTRELYVLLASQTLRIGGLHMAASRRASNCCCKTVVMRLDLSKASSSPCRPMVEAMSQFENNL